MFLDMLEPKVQHKNESLEKNWLHIVVSDSGKSVPKMALVNCQKSTQNMKLSTIFGWFWGLFNSSYQFAETTLQQSLTFIWVLVPRHLEV